MINANLLNSFQSKLILSWLMYWKNILMPMVAMTRIRQVANCRYCSTCASVWRFIIANCQQRMEVSHILSPRKDWQANQPQLLFPTQFFSMQSQTFSTTIMWQITFTRVSTNITAVKYQRRQKYPGTPPPQFLKSFVISLPAHLLFYSFQKRSQQGHLAPQGLSIPGLQQLQCSWARFKSGGHLRGSYQPIDIVDYNIYQFDHTKYRISWVKAHINLQQFYGQCPQAKEKYFIKYDLKQEILISFIIIAVNSLLLCLYAQQKQAYRLQPNLLIINNIGMAQFDYSF